MGTHLIGVAGLVLVFVVGTLRPVNLGTLGLVATFLVGTIVVGETPAQMFEGFPIDLPVTRRSRRTDTTCRGRRCSSQTSGTTSRWPSSS